MFKVCGIIGVLKIELFHFFKTERVKQNKKVVRTIWNLLSLVRQSLSKQFQKKKLNIFLFLHWKCNCILYFVLTPSKIQLWTWSVVFSLSLHLNKPELRFCPGLNPARGVSEISDGEDLWQWSRLEKGLHVFRRSTIPQNKFIILYTKTQWKKLFLNIT